MGGKLIRRVIALLREFDLSLNSSGQAVWSLKSGPVYTPNKSSHILIAVSGGLDSTALATLIAKYGTRLGVKERIRFVHVNHQWRANQSNEDQRFVERLGKKLGVKVLVRKVSPPSRTQQGESISWEADARQKRREAFKQWLRDFPGVLLTAHQAEDLAETVLWRVCTGAAGSNGAGIRVVHLDSEAGITSLRPFLSTRRAELQEFLEEEGQTWRIDSTNSDPRFLRARMRARLMPELEAVFPKAVLHLSEWALSLQRSSGVSGTQSSFSYYRGQSEGVQAIALEMASGLLSSGIRLRRAHWLELASKVTQKNWTGTIELPGGWAWVRRAKAKQSTRESAVKKRSHSDSNKSKKRTKIKVPE